MTWQLLVTGLCISHIQAVHSLTRGINEPNFNFIVEGIIRPVLTLSTMYFIVNIVKLLGA